MKNATIVRAWKDAAFRATLPAGAVPAHPAGSAVVKTEMLGAALISSPACTDGGPRCTDSGPNCS
ncbi:mersacidin/lichenicidin family type 2 lantibiotic [Lentzea sp. NPDC006480]|uniref:mersacidin/lichenicidin family type 2 lantibiotic n=1 Tax=Lentzea sp. NPDC006480 TaxID=3157176 RepID=UPI00339F27B7